MADAPFAGDKKAPMRSPLAKIERAIITRNVHRFPRWIEGYHLTLTTIGWSAGVLVFGYFASVNLHWLWGSSAMLVGQWFTDSFDGALGRHRDTGIPKWGFHVDHLLDFVFMWCVPVSYVFIVDGVSVHLIYWLAFIYAALEANSFLGFGSTSEFKITYLGLGPTEIRLVYIVLNALIIFFGPGLLETILPWVVGVTAAGFVVVFYRTQRRIWRLDMDAKG